MSDFLTRETLLPPFTAFNFRVELYVDALEDESGGDESEPKSGRPLCSAAFAECDGLEITMEPKTIREGGNNAGQLHLIGPISYGQITLKRGMTSNFDLWKWFDKIARPQQAGLRATGLVVMYSSDQSTVNAQFVLDGCLPIKLKAPALNAKDGFVALEEMQLVYERLKLERP